MEVLRDSKDWDQVLLMGSAHLNVELRAVPKRRARVGGVFDGLLFLVVFSRFMMTSLQFCEGLGSDRTVGPFRRAPKRHG